MNALFTKQLRLQKSFQFRLVSTHGKRLKGRFFVVLYKKTTGNNRLGITVSKKCSKRAVDRNRIKRLVRESFRTNQQRFNDYEVVVIARHLAVGATSQALFAELDSTWKKLAKK